MLNSKIESKTCRLKLKYRLYGFYGLLNLFQSYTQPRQSLKTYTASIQNNKHNIPLRSQDSDVYGVGVNLIR